MPIKKSPTSKPDNQVTQSQFNQAMGKIDTRFEKIDQRFEKIDQRFEKLEAKVDIVAENELRTGVLLEEIQSQLQLVLECVQPQSERLADHEARITKLEQSPLLPIKNQ